MAKVSLRIYNRDIEALIEQEQVAEAVAHCHHILKSFPKHLETYKLLGKAYLEARRYTDAADIFQRVLMSVPDDFVSHVGMSIIRDDEKNLDQAIWHMERAFEAQPSNAAVQGELRTLYGRRDGMEPPKIRMTRGALAHMYLQGQLYAQAIAEIRAVLADEPQRVDMQTLLAKAYFFAGQRVETTELCSTLLKKYPYNFEANRITVEILPSTGRAESTQVYRHRVAMLDPYAMFATTSMFELGSVPDAAVNLERLEYDPDKDDTLGADWASSLGIKLESERSETPPDWLSASAVDEESSAPAIPAATPNAAEDIPDFLRQAGWQPSTGEFQEGPVDFDSDEGEGADGELAPASIPDWLQNMAPPDEPDSEPADQADLDFLSTAKPPSQGEEIPDWLKDATPEGGEAAMTLSSGEDETPDWLNLGDDSETPAQAEVPAEKPSDTDVPDWLGELSGAEADESDALEVLGVAGMAAAAAADLTGGEETPAEAQDDSMDWLSDLASEPEAATPAVGEETPDWLDELPGMEQPAASEVPPAPEQTPAASAAGDIGNLGTSADEQDAAMAWLESLAAKQGANEEELLVKPEERLEAAPDWVDKAQAASSRTGPLEEKVQPAAEESLDWLGELSQDEPSFEAPELASQEETSQPEAEAFEVETGVPDWLGDLSEVEEPVVEQPTQPESSGGIGDLGTSADEQDAAMAWLESLAAKQGANEEELLVKPEERLESAPEWVGKAQAVSSGTGPLEEEVQPAAEESLDALRDESAFEASEQPEMVASASDEDLSSWLDELSEEETLAETPGAEQAAPGASGIGDLGTSTDEQDAAMAWLESLAAKQGANEEELLVKPEERLESAPDWVDKAQAASAEQAPAPAEESTEWLQEFAEAEEAQPAAEAAAPESEISFEWADEERPVSDASSVTAWLQTLDDEKPQVEPAALESAAVPELPSWLDETSTGADDDLPDWLRGEDEAAGPRPESPVPTSPVEWQPEASAEPVVEEETPPLVAAEPEQPKAEPAPEPEAPPPGIRASTPIPTMRRTGMLGPTKDIVLLEAQTELQRGNLQAALDSYGKMIKKNRLLDEVIYDLREATYRYPVDVTIWQTLGDAYMRANRLQDALDAYTKAEELLR